MELSWDENFYIVINHLGQRFVLGEERAEEVYQASMRIYRRLKREGKV